MIACTRCGRKKTPAGFVMKSNGERSRQCAVCLERRRKAPSTRQSFDGPERDAAMARFQAFIA